MVTHAFVSKELKFRDVSEACGWTHITHITEALRAGDFGITHLTGFAHVADTPDDLKGQRVHEVGAVGSFEYTEKQAAGDVVARHPPYSRYDMTFAKVKACPAVVRPRRGEIGGWVSVEGFFGVIQHRSR